MLNFKKSGNVPELTKGDTSFFHTQQNLLLWNLTFSYKKNKTQCYRPTKHHTVKVL